MTGYASLARRHSRHGGGIAIGGDPAPQPKIHSLPMKGITLNALSKLVFAVTLAAAASVAHAQDGAHGGHGPNDGHAGHQAPAAAELTDGEVRKIDKEAGKITLRHGELKNLDMAAMSMVFRVKDAGMLEQVKVGDKVRFAADRINGAVTIVQLQAAQQGE